MNLNDFEELTKIVKDINEQHELLRKDMLSAIDSYISADITEVIDLSEFSRFNVEVNKTLKYSGSNTSAMLSNTSKAYTRHKNKITKLQLQEDKVVAKDIASQYGKNMFTAADILDRTLDVADGLICIHRGVAVSEIGLCFLPDVDLIKGRILLELSNLKAGNYVFRSTNSWDNSEFHMELDKTRELSETYRNNKDWLNHAGLITNWVNNSNTMEMCNCAAESINLRDWLKRIPISQLSGIPKDRAEFVSKAVLIVKKVGASDYTVVDPSVIKVYDCDQIDINKVKLISPDNKGVLISKLMASKYPIDISLLVDG